MKVFVNGRIVSSDQAVISVFDHGFLYGFGLFETIRAYEGKMFLFERHYERLKSAAEEYAIRMGKTAGELAQDTYLTLASNELEDAYIRISLSGGIGGLGLWGEEHEQPSWVIMAKPLGPMPSQKRLIPLHLPRASKEGKQRAKSLSFANNMLARKELVKRGVQDAEGIFLNENGYVVEGTVSNLFFIKNGVVYTPSVETGLLDGVTRRFIIELCKSLQLTVREGFFTVDDLADSDEAFMTNSIQEMVPIEKIDQHKLPTVSGPVTSLLMEHYRQAVGDMIRGERK